MLSLGVHVLDALGQLLDEEFGLVHRKGFVPFVSHILVKTDAADVLLDDEDLLR
jgi:hypothetical protein